MTAIARERRGRFRVQVVEIIAAGDGVETDAFAEAATGKTIGMEK